TGRRLVVPFRSLDQVEVLVGERFIVVVDDRQRRIMEDVEQSPELTGTPEPDAVSLFFPAAAIYILIFPSGRITGTWFRLDIIPPHVFGSFSIRPDICARHGARVTADALVQMKQHRKLRPD